MSSSRFTIVIPSYNHEKFVGQALTSALNQDIQESYEILIFDDCSTDGSFKTIEAIAAVNRDRIKVIRATENSGSYVKSMHNALSYVRTEYFVILQCDDMLKRNYLSTICDYLDLDKNVYFTGSELINSDDKFILNDYDIREKRFKRLSGDTNFYFAGTELLKLLSFSCIIPNISAVTWKTEFYRNSMQMNSDYSIVADWAFYLDLALQGDGFYYIKSVLNCFRQHENTIRTREGNSELVRQILDMFIKRKRVLIEQIGCDVFYTNLFAIILHNIEFKSLKKFIILGKDTFGLKSYQVVTYVLKGGNKLFLEKYSRKLR